MQQSIGSSAPITYIYRFKHILSFDAWSNFMNTHNPNTGLSTLTFPEYKAIEDKLVILDIPGSEIQQNVRSSYCDFWDSVGYFF